LTTGGVHRAIHGLDIRPEDGDRVETCSHGVVRLLGPEGELIGLAEPSTTAPGLLHPSVVLM